ncbi:MAG: hypothetical protein ABJP33_16850 [Pseudoruegeria sp.]
MTVWQELRIQRSIVAAKQGMFTGQQLGATRATDKSFSVDIVFVDADGTDVTFDTADLIYNPATLSGSNGNTSATLKTYISNATLAMLGDVFQIEGDLYTFTDFVKTGGMGMLRFQFPLRCPVQ